MQYVLVISYLFLVIATAMDVAITDEGIKKGIAFEGNTLIQKFFGLKPTLRQLLIYWGAALALHALLVIGAVFFGIGAESFAAATVVVAGLVHLKGYQQWRKLGAHASLDSL